LYQEAAHIGLSVAASRLGLCFERGLGVTQNWSEAAKWYQVAAQHGDASAQNALAFCYYFGNGVARNILEAYAWIQLATDQNEVKADEVRALILNVMSPSEIKAARELYQEYKQRYSVRPQLHAGHT